MRLVIYFPGTGSSNLPFQYYANQYDRDDIRIITVEGCTHEEVCNGNEPPDLDEFANRFINTVFQTQWKDDGSIGLFLKSDTLHGLRDLKVGINQAGTTVRQGDKGQSITEITCCGYSRGALTCLLLARALQRILPNIPVNIVVDQPVPGELFPFGGLNSAKVSNCRDLVNLRGVSLILGAYTGIKGGVVDFKHKSGYSQIVPEVPIKLDIAVIPKTHHSGNSSAGDCIEKLELAAGAEPTIEQKQEVIRLDKYHFIIQKNKFYLGYRDNNDGYEIKELLPENWCDKAIIDALLKRFLEKGKTSTADKTIIKVVEDYIRSNGGKVPDDAPFGYEHMHLQLARYLNLPEFAQAMENVIKTKYTKSKPTFPDISELQPIFGISGFFGTVSETFYLDVDPLYSLALPGKPTHYGWNPGGETLFAWWDKHEQRITASSSHKTQNLVTQIHSVSGTCAKNLNLQALEELLPTLNNWLKQKDPSASLRYFQVLALWRNVNFWIARIRNDAENKVSDLRSRFDAAKLEENESLAFQNFQEIYRQTQTLTQITASAGALCNKIYSYLKGDFLSLCAMNPDTALILTVHEWLYPERAAIINALANEIIKVLIQGNVVVQSCSHDNSFVKLFLQIVFHQNDNLTQILDAFNERNGQLQLVDINHINLIIPIAVKFQSDNGMSDILQGMMNFTAGDRDIYEHIINNLSRIVSEGMSDWYIDIAKRVEIPKDQQQLTLVPSNTTTLGHYPKPMAQDCTTTTALVSRQPQPLPLTPFPTDALKVLLEFADSFGVKEILERAHQEPEESSFANGVRCIPGVGNYLEGPGMVAKIARGNLDLALVGNGVRSLLNGEIGAAKQSRMEIEAYLQNFCTNPEDNSTLNFQRLMLALVMDKGLKELLEIKDYRVIIAKLGAATGVPDFTEEKVEQSIDIFIRLQRSAQDLPASTNITTLGELLSNVMAQDFDNTMDLIAKGVMLIKQLKQVVSIFIQPKIIAIHLLAHPAIVGILSNISESVENVDEQYPTLPLQSDPNETFIDCARYFLNYQEKGNGLLTTPTERYIREKKLEHYHFSNSACLKVEDETTIVHNFIGCGFDGFSFQHSTFSDVNLQDTYFKECDFSHTEFVGLIIFDDTYMDNKTATSFLHALEKSLLQGQCKVKGTITFVGEAEESLCIPKSITENVGIDFGDADAVRWVKLDVDEKFPTRHDDCILDLDESFEEDSESTDCEESSYFGMMTGALGTALQYGAGGISYAAKKGANALNPFGGTGQEDSGEGKKGEDAEVQELRKGLRELRQQVEENKKIQQTTAEYLGNQQAHLQTQLQALPAQTTTVPAIEYPEPSHNPACLPYHDNSLPAIGDGSDKSSAPTVMDIPSDEDYSSSDEDDFKSFSSDEESDDDMTPASTGSEETPSQPFVSRRGVSFFPPNQDGAARKENPQQTECRLGRAKRNPTKHY